MDFPFQAILRNRPELHGCACAVLDGKLSAQKVCSLNAKARELGVQMGMTRVELNTIRGIAVLERSRPHEESARAVLLECAGRFSPAIEAIRSDTALLWVLDITGTEKYCGPAEILGRALLEAVKAIGMHVSIAIADNFHASVCMARGNAAHEHPVVISPGEEKAALAALPVGMLELPESQHETLTRWGIRTLEMLAALPEEQLISRLGQDGKKLQQLASGTARHLFVPIEQPFTLLETMDCDSPVEASESLLFLVGLLLERLILRASSRVLALASVTIRLALEGGGSHSRTVRPALPSNSRQLWLKLIHLDMEGHPPNRAVLALQVAAEHSSVKKVQLGLFSAQLPDIPKLDITLARIQAIVGEGCVGSPTLQDTHKPDSFTVNPFVVSMGRASQKPIKGRVAPPVAIRQLRPPESTAITLRDSRPSAFYFRKCRYRVEQAYGPWHSHGDWWSDSPWKYACWDVIAKSDANALLCCSLVNHLSQNTWEIAALYD